MEILYNPYVVVVLFVVSLLVGSWWKLKRTKNVSETDTIQLNSFIVPAVIAVAGLYQVTPVTLPTLTIDTNAIFTLAFDIVNSFMPLIAIIAGLGLGFNLVGKISSLFSRSI